MKKIICVIMASAMLAGLCACNDKSDERLTPAETAKQSEEQPVEQSGEQTEGSTSGQNSEAPEVQVIESDDVAVVDPVQDKAVPGEIPVSFGDKDAEEIVYILQKTRKISFGSTLDDYMMRFSVSPEIDSYDNVRHLYWTSNDGNSLRSIKLTIADSGKILAEKDSIIEIVVWMDGQQKAADVYDKLVKSLTAELGDPEIDDRESYTWGTIFGNYSLQMFEVDGIYQLTMFLKILEL